MNNLGGIECVDKGKYKIVSCECDSGLCRCPFFSIQSGYWDGDGAWYDETFECYLQEMYCWTKEQLMENCPMKDQKIELSWEIENG